MSDLIEALQIFLKYGDPKYPTHCEHDMLTVAVNPELVSDKDKKRLKKLGFHAGGPDSDAPDAFYSFRFGSC